MFPGLYNKLDVKMLLIMFFFASLIIRASMTGLTGTPVIFPDELLYMRLANSFFHNFNTDFRENYFLSNNVFYPILLSISYLFSKPDIFYPVMKLINCVLMSAVIFPAYYISKYITNKKGISLLIALISISIPDMFSSLLIAQESLYYFVCMCTFYLILREVNNNSYKNSLLLGLFLYLSFSTKAVGIVLTIGYIGMVLNDYLIIKSNSLKHAIRRLVYTLGSFAILFIVIRFILMAINGFPNVDSLYNNVTDININIDWLVKMIFGFIIYFFYISLAFFIIPVIIMVSNISRQNEYINKFSIYIFLTMITTIFIVVFTIFVKETQDTSNIRIFTRYFFIYFIPILAISIKNILDNKMKLSFRIISLTACFILLSHLLLEKIRLVSYPLFSDAPMLIYFRLINNSYLFEIGFNILIIVGLIFISYYLIKRKNYRVTNILIAVILVGSIFNNFVLYKNYSDFNNSEIYGSESLKKEINNLSNYLSEIEKKESELNLLLMPQEYYGGADDFKMVSLESMLNFKYHYLPLNESISGDFKDGNYSLKGYAPSAYIYTNSPKRSIETVDYLVTTVNNAEFDNVEPVTIDGVGKHFKVFKINNSEFNVKYLVDNLYHDKWNDGEVKLRVYSKEQTVKITLHVEALPDTKLIIKQEGGVFEEKSIKAGEPITFTAHNINGNYIDITLSGSTSFIPQELDPNSSDMRELSFKLLDITL